MRRLADFCISHRRLVVLTWVLILVGSGVAANSVGSTFKQNFSLPKSDSQQAVQLLQDRFPQQSGDTAQVVFHAREGTLRDPATQARIKAALQKVQGDPHVESVTPPAAGTVSKDARTAYATVAFDKRSFELSTSTIQQVIDDAQSGDSSRLQVELGGQPIEQARQGGASSTEAVGLAAAIIVLLLTFGSLVAMGMPVLTALIALGTGASLITLATHVFDISDFTPALASMIGLGVGIDYALFVVTRFRSGLRDGLDPREAVTLSMDTAGRAVLFAGTTVVIALLGMFALGISFLYGPAVAASLSVLLTMVASLTLLPAVLSKVGRRIDRLRVPGLGKAKPPEKSRWMAWARLIQRRPWVAAISSLLVLLVLTLPALHMQLGSADAGTDPGDSTTRKAYDLLAAGFGPGFNGPLQVVAELPGSGDTAGLRTLRARLAAQPDVAAVTPPRVNPAGDTAVLDVVPTTSPQSEKTKDLVHRIRDDVAPAVSAGDGPTIHVGGTTAIFDDFSSLLARKLPLFIGIVVALSALLLMAVFRSVLVPLKAVVMNLLSIGAALGIVVKIFQDGWLNGLLGIDGTAPIAAFLPVMVFAIVFGLSMDYEVFLMSRVHEEWSKSHDASKAVVDGLANTGRVITAAAMIMVFVFLSFVLGDELTIKLFGIGLAAAVFIDAFLIRSVLVPAIMQLLGERAWWLPRRLDRVLPRFGVEPPPRPVTADT
jgi:RND superfamily putative drug exporter